MTEFIVTKRETCPICDGDGYLYDEDWARFNEEFKGVSQSANQGEMFAWWREQGYSVYSWKDTPPEEHQCWKCNGRGYLDGVTTLSEALKELGVIQ